MARKSKDVRSETVKAAERLKELDRLLKEAEEEEKKRLEDVENQIREVAAVNGMFCGVILTVPDLLGVIEVALRTKENVQIPFRLYYNE